MSVTSNKNFLSPNGFKLTISAKEFENVEYFCTSAPLPPIALGEANLPFRNRQNSVAGDKVNYMPFDIRFQVSENMENYIELFNWLVYNSNNDVYKDADIILHILNSNNNVIRQVRFNDAFPTSLGAIDFHTQNTDVEYVSVDASFQYSHFEFIK